MSESSKVGPSLKGLTISARVILRQTSASVDVRF